jgi:hypothetical protein
VPRMLAAVYAALAAGTRPPIEPRHMLASAMLIDRIADMSGVLDQEPSLGGLV